MEHNAYGRKIQKVRALKGYSQEYMAEKLGMSNAKAYSRYETGEAKLDLPHLEAIAKVLELTVIELLSFDERVFFNQCTQHHVLGSNNTYHEGVHERALYEARIKELQDEVAYLRKKLDAQLEVRR